MKPEKMTDERLELRLKHVFQVTGPNAADELRAHISALNAEMDDVRSIHAANVEAGIELAKEFNRVGGIGNAVDGVFRRARALLAEVVGLRAKWATAETEINAAQRQANEAASERDAIRERLLFEASEHEAFLARLHEALGTNDGQTGADLLKAAEDLRRRAEDAEHLRNERNAAESRLAAIRQRSEDVDAIVRVMHKEATEAHATMMLEKRQGGDLASAVLSAVGIGAVRYVVGVYEKANQSNDDSPPQTDDLGVVEQWRENQEARAPVEPTTVEAFATVRDGLGVEDEQANASLSLLERRMGAMERALKALLKSGIDSQWMESGKRVGLCAMANAALADATPVFTLEDVEGCMRDDVECWTVVRDRLTALRK